MTAVSRRRSLSSAQSACFLARPQSPRNTHQRHMGHAECNGPQRHPPARRQPTPPPSAPLHPAHAARLSPPARRGSRAQPDPRQALSPAKTRVGLHRPPAALAALVQLARRRARRGYTRSGKRGARQAKDHRESQANTSGHGRPPSVCATSLAHRTAVGQLTGPPASHMFDRRAPSIGAHRPARSDRREP